MRLAEDSLVDAKMIEEARQAVSEVALRTPLVPASVERGEARFLKLESLQRTGSFKLRGAWNRMRLTTEKQRRRGFVTISAGNHGQAVAWVARRLGATCTVITKDDAPRRKTDAMSALGATLEYRGFDEIMDAMLEQDFEYEGRVYIHPFADPHVMAGQATVGTEILDDLPTVGSIVVPIGGGGLASGVAAAVAARNLSVPVFGVQAANAAPVVQAYSTGRQARIQMKPTIADGIGASVAFGYMAPRLSKALAGVFTVTEESLRRAVRDLAVGPHVVAEAAGAAAYAAAREHEAELVPPVACIVSGGNIDAGLLSQILAG